MPPAPLPAAGLLACYWLAGLLTCYWLAGYRQRLQKKVQQHTYPHFHHHEQVQHKTHSSKRTHISTTTNSYRKNAADAEYRMRNARPFYAKASFV